VDEIEGSGADWFLVNPSGVPALIIASAYSCDWIAAYSMAKFDRNGASGWLSAIRTV
jgi:hypothetical protein